MGASAAAVERLRASIDAAEGYDREIRIWPDHWHAFQVFCGMGSQWRTHMGSRGLFYLGLDYSALAPVLAEHRRCPHRQPLERLMPQLRELEATARPLLNED